MKVYWIPGNTPSLKNSKNWNGRFLESSTTVKNWVQKVKMYWLVHKREILLELRDLPKPYYIEFTFVRGSRHAFDYINIVQVVCDEMQKAGLLEDDNADILKPYFGDYRYDKDNPGVEIRILKEKPKHY